MSQVLDLYTNKYGIYVYILFNICYKSKIIDIHDLKKMMKKVLTNRKLTLKVHNQEAEMKWPVSGVTLCDVTSVEAFWETIQPGHRILNNRSRTFFIVQVINFNSPELLLLLSP